MWRFAIEYEEDVAFLYEPVVLNPEVIDEDRYVRRDRHDVGLHGRITWLTSAVTMMPRLTSVTRAVAM